MDVVILAGGKCTPELEALGGTPYRAMLPFHGRPMVEIVRNATSFLGPPIIVGGPPGMSDRQTTPGETFIESLNLGLNEVKTKTFLLATSDLPFITEVAIKDFIDRCTDNATIYYPIINVNTIIDPRYVGLKRTTLRLQEGRFTGGNIAIINADLIRKVLPLMQQAYDARKSPVQLAKMIGLETLAQVLIGQVCPQVLSIKKLERAIERFLKEPVKAIVTPYAEVGIDVDNAEHYKALEAQK